MERRSGGAGAGAHGRVDGSGSLAGCRSLTAQQAPFRVILTAFQAACARVCGGKGTRRIAARLGKGDGLVHVMLAKLSLLESNYTPRLSLSLARRAPIMWRVCRLPKAANQV